MIGRSQHRLRWLLNLVWTLLCTVTGFGADPATTFPSAASVTPAPAAPAPVDYGEDDVDELAKYPAAERPARKACTICHLFVEPNMLTKTNWSEQILPRMMCELGLAIPDYASSPDGELIRQRKVYPDQPRVPSELWPQIESFYLTQAPDSPLPQSSPLPIGIGLKLFKTEVPRFRNRPPFTTLVKIDPQNRCLYVGDDKAGTITILDPQGEPRQTLRDCNVPVDIVVRDQRLYVTGIGSFLSTERYLAQFMAFERVGEGYGERKILLHDLPRTVQAQFADFNQDGKMDFVLCMFGNRTGRFSWFENKGPDQYEEHVLSSKAGAMYCDVRDLNGDGAPDILVLFAQELEMLVLMLNDGKGNFTSDSLFQKPPVWGHSFFEAVDFNRDGRPDLIVVNGDNGEYQSPTKPYHGIRLLMNQGGNQFEEVLFLPLNGAYKALARDFDGDGDLDIAAISYFPDYVNSPRESFVYYENLGDLKFAANTFRECIAGRWLVMDAGDLDGDGDLDLILGAYCFGPKEVPQFLLDVWTKGGASVVILRNQLQEMKAGRTSPGTAPSATPSG